MTRHAKLPLILCLIAAGAAAADLGLFTDAGGVGDSGGKAQYDAATGVYQVTGGGADIWGAADTFYFVWKKMPGNLSLTADVQFEGAGASPRRKAVLMIRQSLDAGAAYADAAFHGNGMTSLQFRGASEGPTYQLPTELEPPVRMRIVRQGNRYTLFAGKPGGELKQAGPVESIVLKDPVYVGLGVCSHMAGTLETAVFSNVKIEPLP